MRTADFGQQTVFFGGQTVCYRGGGGVNALKKQ